MDEFSSFENQPNKRDESPLHSAERASVGNDGILDSFTSDATGGTVHSGSSAGTANASYYSEPKKSASSARGSSSSDGVSTQGSEVPASQSATSVAAAAEHNPTGFWHSSGSSANQVKNAKNSVKGAFQKYGPLGGILVALIIIVSLVSGSQSTMMFSLSAQITETFNSMQTPSKLRSNNILTKYLSGGLNSKYSKKFKLSEKQTSRLAESGITVNEDYNGTKTRVLEFDGSDGNHHVVFGDGVDIDVKEGDVGINFSDLYNSNADFHQTYGAATQGWRGAISNWFNNVTVDFLKRNSLTRNLFKDYIAKNDINSDDEGSAFKIINDKIGDGDIDGSAKTIDEDPSDTDGDGDVDADDVVDSDGNNRNLGVDDADVSLKKNSSASDVASALQEIGDKYSNSKVSGVLSAITNGSQIVCAASSVIGGITAIVMGQQILTIMNTATSYLESTDKAKAGDGSKSPINELGNSLTKTTTTSYSTTGASVTGSAMEAAGITSLYSGKKVNASDPSVESFNLVNSLKKSGGFTGIAAAAGIASLTAGSLKTCSVAKSVGSVASMVDTILSFAGGPIAWLVQTLVGIGIGAAISALISAVISVATPFVVDQLSKNFVSEFGGEDLGNALAFGSNTYLGSTHRTNGGSIASEESYISFKLAEKEVIADNAKLERETRDPLDVTSKYTFLGTLANQFTSFASTTSIVSSLNTASTLVKDSTVALLPESVASAYDLAEEHYSDEEYAEICPFLSGIGATGDAACNPYVITDVSTLNDDPEDVLNEATTDSQGNPNLNVDDDGNPTVVDGSDLSKYILYCANRESAFGITDYNIQNSITTSGSSTRDFVIGSIPIVGDVADIVQNKDTLANMGYITGESCVTDNNSGGGQSENPSWSKAKHYQRFIEDQSLLETTGAVEKSAVTAYLEDYYEKHPVDNSYTGILARYSGMLKEDVVAILESVKWLEYIADYETQAGDRNLFGKTDLDTRLDNVAKLITSGQVAVRNAAGEKETVSRFSVLERKAGNLTAVSESFARNSFFGQETSAPSSAIIAKSSASTFLVDSEKFLRREALPA